MKNKKCFYEKICVETLNGVSESRETARYSYGVLPEPMIVTITTDFNTALDLIKENELSEFDCGKTILTKKAYIANYRVFNDYRIFEKDFEEYKKEFIYKPVEVSIRDIISYVPVEQVLEWCKDNNIDFFKLASKRLVEGF